MSTKSPLVSVLGIPVLSLILYPPLPPFYKTKTKACFSFPVPPTCMYHNNNIYPHQKDRPQNNDGTPTITDYKHSIFMRSSIKHPNNMTRLRTDVSFYL